MCIFVSLLGRVEMVEQIRRGYGAELDLGLLVGSKYIAQQTYRETLV